MMVLSWPPVFLRKKRGKHGLPGSRALPGLVGWRLPPPNLAPAPRTFTLIRPHYGVGGATVRHPFLRSVHGHSPRRPGLEKPSIPKERRACLGRGVRNLLARKRRLRRVGPEVPLGRRKRPGPVGVSARPPRESLGRGFPRHLGQVR
jgi:hypothetical protein